MRYIAVRLLMTAFVVVIAPFAFLWTLVAIWLDDV
jgi:hypothetical protein